MIRELALVAGVALLWYVIFPRLARTMARRKTEKRISFLKKCIQSSEAIYLFSGFSGQALECTQEHTSSAIQIEPGKTRFFLLDRSHILHELEWRNVQTLRSGTPLLYTEVPGWPRKAVCVIQDGRADIPFRTLISALTPAQHIPRDDTHWFTAFGIFFSALLFLRFLQLEESDFPGLAALLAIFGRLLPWFPPGLVLTLGAHWLYHLTDDDEKKSRRRRISGNIMEIAGILLNIAAFFFLIVKTGFSFR